MEKPTASQIAANRENAKKSTGPRTPQGKAKVAHNGVTHGFYTRDLILRRKDSPEDPAEFDALLAELFEEYVPTTAIERALVENVAACLWRRRRAHRFEAAAMARQLDKAADDRTFHEMQSRDATKRFEEVSAEIDVLNSQIAKLKNPPDQADAAARAEFNVLVRSLAARFKRSEQGQPLIDRLLKDLEDQVIIHCGMLMSIKDQYGKLADEHVNVISQDVDILLPPYDELGKLVRYENMLNRQLHRALYELRRIKSAAQEETIYERDISP